jgi:hypothetical protein
MEGAIIASCTARDNSEPIPGKDFGLVTPTTSSYNQREMQFPKTPEE